MPLESPPTQRVTPVKLQKKLRRVWDAMELAMNRAIFVQREGEVFDHSPGYLFYTVNEISAEETGRLEEHEREMVDFARKFATLLNGMAGIRLRQQEDGERSGEEKTPQVQDESCIEEERVDKEEESEVKEEPENEEEVQFFPLFCNDIGAEVEIKTEEVYEEEEVTFDDLREPVLQKEQEQQEVEGAVDTMRKRGAPVHSEDFGTVKRKPMDASLPSASPTRNRMDTAQKQSLPGDVIYSSSVENALIDLIQCERCLETMEEREFAVHEERGCGGQRKVDASSSSSSSQSPVRRVLAEPKLVPCEDEYCDFASTSGLERVAHKMSIHSDVYNYNWKVRGRLNFVRGVNLCPMCPTRVYRVDQLLRHLLSSHPNFANGKMKMFVCSSCNNRFSRAHQVYAHWHKSRLCVGQMRMDHSRRIFSIDSKQRNCDFPKKMKFDNPHSLVPHGNSKSRNFVCTKQVDEKKIVANPHSLVPERTNGLIACPEPSCDFVCITLEEAQKHVEAIHCVYFKYWKTMGRVGRLFAGSLCPYCPYGVDNLDKYLLHVATRHHTRILPEAPIYCCASCDYRFNRLHLMYEHWHTSPECKGHMRVGSPAHLDAALDRPLMEVQPRLPNILDTRSRRSRQFKLW